MLYPKPVYGDLSQLACARVFFKFKEDKLPQLEHNLGDCIGAHYMLFNYSPLESTYTLTYINNEGMVLKRVSYVRESVSEINMDRSICKIDTKPPHKVV